MMLASSTKYRREKEPKNKRNGKTKWQDTTSKRLRVPFRQSGFENLPTEGKESLEFAIFRISKADTPNRNVSQFSN
jgi:hypothetical protein